MGSHRIVRLIAALALVASAGCAEQTVPVPPVPPTGAAPVAAPAPAQTEPAPAPPAAAPVAPPLPPPAAEPPPSPRPSEEVFVDQPALADVLFDARRSDIGQRGADIMQSNARWLIENPGFIVLIEGHSDFKGSPQGNLALGERRARAARDFLVRAGVSPDRIQIATYGSERPLCPEKTEACAARNRRVHFLVRPQ